MRWLLLKDLQILKRSPLLVALLIGLLGGRLAAGRRRALVRPGQAAGRVRQPRAEGAVERRARRPQASTRRSTRTSCSTKVDPIRVDDARGGDREGASRARRSRRS